MKFPYSIIGSAILAGGFQLLAEDWPEFRGPSGQGISEAAHLPLQWSQTSNVVWKAAIPGRGWSSPAVRDGRIFLTAAVPSEQGGGQSLRTLCLRAADGSLEWDVEIFRQGSGAPGIHAKNSHASPTPIAEAGRVHVHFGHHGSACLDWKGGVLWRSQRLAYEPVHGNGGSPILTGDALIFSCDGASDPFVAALNKSDGSVLWKTPRSVPAQKNFSFSTPLLISVRGKPQVISPGSNAVYAYDPKTGQELWRVRYNGYSVIPRPVYGHGLIFIGTGFDRPTVMAIRPDGAGDVTDTHVAWTVTRSAPNTPSLLLVQDELYMVSDGGIASCLDARTGQIHWQERVGGNYSASPLYGAGRIYFQNEEGAGVVIAAGKAFRKLAENPLHERTLASYAITGGSIFLRSDKHLYRISQPGL